MLEVVNFTGYHLIRRTLQKKRFSRGEGGEIVMSLKMAYRWRIKKGQQFWLQRKNFERESILYTVVK